MMKNSPSQQRWVVLFYKKFIKMREIGLTQAFLFVIILKHSYLKTAGGELFKAVSILKCHGSPAEEKNAKLYLLMLCYLFLSFDEKRFSFCGVYTDTGSNFSKR